MGLDQYLYQQNPPNLLDPFEVDHTEIAYWRKDWDLQNYINCGNCDKVYLTEDDCEQILADLPYIYPESDQSNSLDYTKRAFTEALDLLKSGERIYYVPWW
jgi:hypothetical protein